MLLPLAMPYLHALVPEPAAYAPGLSADIASYLGPPEDTWVGQMLEHRWVSTRAGSGASRRCFSAGRPSLLAIIGAVATVQRVMQTRGEARDTHLLALFFVALTIVGVWLSFGPTAGWFSPFTVLSALPGVSLFRAPARFALLVILGVSVLAAIGLQQCLEARRRPREALDARRLSRCSRC